MPQKIDHKQEVQEPAEVNNNNSNQKIKRLTKYLNQV